MQEEPDQRHRWLLPFTKPLDLPVWDAILRVAAKRKAAVVAVSFTTQPELQTPFVYQEMLGRKQMFLSALHLHACARAVPLECYEESSVHVLARIMTMTREFQCDSLLLGSWQGHAFFLSRDIARVLLVSPPARLVLLQLPEQRERLVRFEQRRARFVWLRTLARQAGSLLPSAALAKHVRKSQSTKPMTREQKRSHEPCPEHEFYW